MRPGIEVRAPGNLSIASDWALPVAGADLRAASPHAGDASLTLRAGGTLNIGYGVSSGFQSANEFEPLLQVASSDRGGSLRGVGGADLASADPLATAGTAGDIVVGRAGASSFTAPPTVAVRTTTGTIELRSARDIRLANSAATVATTGAPVQAPIDLTAIAIDLVSGDFGPLTPFLSSGGSISLEAGRDVIGSAPNANRPYVTDWWWRSAGALQAWWSRYDLFDQGVATFGGGDVAVRAGRDLVDVRAAAASSGYVATATSAPPAVLRYGGGSLLAQAGRDVVNGLYFASGSTLDLAAAGTIRYDSTLAGALFSTDPGVQLVHEDSVVRVQAGSDIPAGERAQRRLQLAGAGECQRLRRRLRHRRPGRRGLALRGVDRGQDRASS